MVDEKCFDCVCVWCFGFIFVGVLVLVFFKVVLFFVVGLFGVFLIFVICCVFFVEVYCEVEWCVVMFIGCMFVFGEVMLYIGMVLYFVM